MIDGSSILITGGTGSFGKAFCEHILKNYKPARLIVYSRDEFKQAEMAKEHRFRSPAMRFFLGDVRDKERLIRAVSGVDIVIHAAALKQVPAAEYNPHEFIKTNIEGAVNVVDAALSANVAKVIALSTDKAVNPVNLYGATKLCSDKVFVAANSYSGRNKTRFSVVRYGNVIGSRGSVIPLFLQQRATGTLTITDPEMTRFYLTLEDGVKLVINTIRNMVGGEIFIPKIPSCRLRDLAEAIAPDAAHKIIGTRPGEKKHEVLIPQDEAHNTLEYPEYYIIQPQFTFWQDSFSCERGRRVPYEFSYSSDKNDRWIGQHQILQYSYQVAKELNIPMEYTASCL